VPQRDLTAISDRVEYVVPRKLHIEVMVMVVALQIEWLRLALLTPIAKQPA